jgi:hypothetical protein
MDSRDEGRADWTYGPALPDNPAASDAVGTTAATGAGKTPNGQPWYVTGSTPPPADVLTVGSAAEPGSGGSSRWRGRRTTIVGAVAAGVVAVALGVGVVEASGSGGAGASAAQGVPAGGQGGLPGIQGQGGSADQDGGAGGAGQLRGGRDGETHVLGTVTAVTATSVTVRDTSGATATYSVDSSSQVLEDGRAVAVTSLSKGARVLVHAIARSGGTAYAERVLAGSSATEGPGGGFGRPDGGAGAPPDGTTAGSDGSTTTA